MNGVGKGGGGEAGGEPQNRVEKHLAGGWLQRQQARKKRVACKIEGKLTCQAVVGKQAIDRIQIFGRPHIALQYTT